MGNDNSSTHIVVDTKSQILFVICGIIIFSSAIITYYKYIVLRDFEVIDAPLVEEVPSEDLEPQ